MKGYLLIFNKKSGKDSVKLNHKLMGRIISVPRNGTTTRYYKSGALDVIPHKRLINGCYFSKGDISFNDDGLVKLKADVQVYDGDLKTARGFWKNHARKNKLEVKNL